MTTRDRTSLDITIVVVDPPFAAGGGVLFGMQARRDVDDPRPACADTEFRLAIDVVQKVDSATDFAGECVHGRRGDRFLYLAWGIPATSEPFVMFARAKIKLDDIPAELLDAAVKNGQPLIVELQATNEKGQPASGTVRPPSIRWSGS